MAGAIDSAVNPTELWNFKSQYSLQQTPVTSWCVITVSWVFKTLKIGSALAVFGA